MTDILKLAGEKHGFSPDDVLKYRVSGDELVVILDKGIAGCPKYRYPLAELEEPEPEVYICDGCLRQFDSERGLATHQRYCDELVEEEE